MKNGRWTLVCALALATVAFGTASASGNPQVGTGSLKIAFNFSGECSLTNYNPDPITVDFIRVFDSNGNQRAGVTNVSIDPNETAKIAFSGQNDRYHCVAGGYHPDPNGQYNYCESVWLSHRTRLVLDALFNGSSTAESEGELISQPCLIHVVE